MLNSKWRYFFQVCRIKYSFFSCPSSCFSQGLIYVQICRGIQNLKKAPFCQIACSPKLLPQPANIWTRINLSYPWHFATLLDLADIRIKKCNGSRNISAWQIVRKTNHRIRTNRSWRVNYKSQSKLRQIFASQILLSQFHWIQLCNWPWMKFWFCW